MEKVRMLAILVTRFRSRVMPSVLLAFCATVALASPQRLSTSGSQILDQNGKSIVLKGYNENYNILGAAQNTLAGDVTMMIRQGANVVRIRLGFLNRRSCADPFYPTDKNVDAYNPSSNTTGYIDPAIWAPIYQQIKWAISEQKVSGKPMWIVFALVGGKCATDFADPTFTSAYLAAWTWLAGRLSQLPDIGAYEVIAEPEAGFSQASLKRFQGSVIRSIRKVDPATPIMVGPSPLYNVRYLTNDYLGPIPNIIYTVDMYELGRYTNQGMKGDPPPWAGYPGTFKDRPFNDTPPCTYQGQGTYLANRYTVVLNHAFLSGLFTCATQFATTHSVPVWVNQFGAWYGEPGSVQWHTDMMNVLRAANVGGAKWVFRQAYTKASNYPSGSGNAVFWQDSALAWHKQTAIYDAMSKWLDSTPVADKRLP